LPRFVSNFIAIAVGGLVEASGANNSYQKSEGAFMQWQAMASERVPDASASLPTVENRA